MKMVKSLLLGSAAGLVAMAGAQAADLPVKAKPVQYVKICSLYGAGFYYIPGTDTCLKVGGWVRMQMGYGYNGDMSNGPLNSNTNDRTTKDFMTRNRGYITADARSQTEYGTLRAYIAVGVSKDNPQADGPSGKSGFSANRAFIQIAGFTAGLATSFYDYVSFANVSYNGASIIPTQGADKGDPGQQVLAYTAQLGNGLSASISAENPRNGKVYQNTSTSTDHHVGNKYPDLVANLRVDQAWGGAQVSGALHNASADYYSTANLAGHPGDVLGWAVAAGLVVKAPSIGKGDFFQATVKYGKGAINYVTAGNNYSATHGADSGSGIQSDGVYGSTGDVELTTAWSAGAAFQHNWNAQWKTSIYGSYASVNYSDRANSLLCNFAGAAVTNSCNNDFSVWAVGSRTAWAPVKDLEVGVDVLYEKLNSRDTATASTSVDQAAWVTHLRIQRNFYP